MNTLNQTDRHVRKLPRKIPHKKVHGKRWRTKCIKDKEIHFYQTVKRPKAFSAVFVGCQKKYEMTCLLKTIAFLQCL